MSKLVFLLIACILGVQASTPNRAARIINGQVAPNVPFHVHVLYVNAQNSGFFGGGVLISNLHVLTVASNILSFTEWRMQLGSSTQQSGVDVISTQATHHPQYNANTRINDIGVIFFPSPIVLTALVNPIALPPMGVMLPLENEQGVTYGFGFTDNVNQVRSPFLNMAFKRVVPNAGANNCAAIFTNQNLETHFCARDPTDNSNICMGDLGGAFTTFYRQREILTGLASLLAHHCSALYPSAYTRISNHREWIHSQTGI